MIRKILVTELIVAGAIFLYFFPLLSLPNYGNILHTLVYGIIMLLLLCYLPGYWRSYLFFNQGELSTTERLVTSIGLSVGITVFGSLYLALAGVSLSGMVGVLISAIAILLGILIVTVTKSNKKIALK